MTHDNPFPGLNPWMQSVWSDMHTMLIGYIRDALVDELPDDLTARAEEGVTLSAPMEKDQHGRMDVSVSEVEGWKRGEPPVWTPQDKPGLADRVAVPVLVTLTPPPATPRWVEIRNAAGRLITAIEVTSPANKTETGRPAIERKLEAFLDGGASFMEIDLVRDGICYRHTRVAVRWPQTPCQVIACRGYDRDVIEVYPCPLREPLPVVRVPLRDGEPDAALDLQELIDRCHKRGRYWMLPYAADPAPPLAPEDLAWSRERLKTAGFTG